MTMLPEIGIYTETAAWKNAVGSMSETGFSTAGMIWRSLAYVAVGDMDVLFTHRAYQFPTLVIWSLLTSRMVTIWKSFPFAARNVTCVAPTLVCLGADRPKEKALAVSTCPC